MNILYYVQSNIGTGHLARSLKIIKHLKANVHLVTGGVDLDQLWAIPKNTINHKLPPVIFDLDLNVIADIKNNSQIWETRIRLLGVLLKSIDFDLIIVEQFPFGGHVFKKELKTIFRMNKEKRHPAKVLCSVRDILVDKEDAEEFAEKTCNFIDSYIDKILVHSDPNYITLDKTFLYSEKIKDKLSYTGYITEPIQLSSRKLNDIPTIIVSIGGGNFGTELLVQTILASNILIKKLSHHLKVFTGPFISPDILVTLYQLTENSPHISINTFSSTFITDVHNSHLSINMGGYNSIIELLQLGVPSIVYPFPQNHEQYLRPLLLNKNGQFSIVQNTELTPDNLVCIIEQRLNNSSLYSTDIDLNGISSTVDFIETYMK